MKCDCGCEFEPEIRYDHRLLCGDSTKREDVERVMGGENAVVCVTDPPYSVNYQESHKVRGGDPAVHGHYHESDINPTDLLQFLDHLPTDLIIFSYSVNRHMYELCDVLKKYKWEVRKELVWVKDTFAFWMGAAYQQRHEPIWICTRNGASFSGSVPSNESTVLEYARPKAHKLHPTAKPLELWAKLIGYHSGRSSLVYEPFSGSGTTIIACEQLGRQCRAIEIAPGYVAVSLERYFQATGKEPHRLS